MLCLRGCLPVTPVCAGRCFHLSSVIVLKALIQSFLINVEDRYCIRLHKMDFVHITSASCPFGVASCSRTTISMCIARCHPYAERERWWRDCYRSCTWVRDFDHASGNVRDHLNVQEACSDTDTLDPCIHRYRTYEYLPDFGLPLHFPGPKTEFFVNCLPIYTVTQLGNMGIELDIWQNPTIFIFGPLFWERASCPCRVPTLSKPPIRGYIYSGIFVRWMYANRDVAASKAPKTTKHTFVARWLCFSTR